MRNDFKTLRLRQLERSLSAFADAKKEARPRRGWLRAIREGLGLTLAEVAKRTGNLPPRIREFESAEAEDRIMLRSLRRVAAAMGCEVVYAIVPRDGTITELAEKHDRERAELSERRVHAQAAKDVRNVEHTMGLEGQATGNIDELIDDETRRRLKR
jgi:predicted DNA-binding mobile mystery protein A